MRVDRKTFLRLAGLAALAPVARRILEAGQAGAARAVSALKARRWAMVIDQQKCRKEQGCDACILACHKTHNVPRIPERAREVKWIWKEPFERVFPALASEYTQISLQGEPVLVFCNHCDQPPCVRVCPTQATWKRDDGIVMMDWHRCIGCRYCVAACPYGSRSFNWQDPRPHIQGMHADYPTRTRGVVEKCTFCDERLAKGQLPACVESCKEKALVFGDLADPESEVRRLLKARFSLRRKPELGTQPEIYYLL